MFSSSVTCHFTFTFSSLLFLYLYLFPFDSVCYGYGYGCCWWILSSKSSSKAKNFFFPLIRQKKMEWNDMKICRPSRIIHPYRESDSYDYLSLCVCFVCKVGFFFVNKKPNKTRTEKKISIFASLIFVVVVWTKIEKSFFVTPPRIK